MKSFQVLIYLTKFFQKDENIDKPLKPAPIINKTLEEHPVFNIPIVIIGGKAFYYKTNV
jgi:hypothetical protein